MKPLRPVVICLLITLIIVAPAYASVGLFAPEAVEGHSLKETRFIAAGTRDQLIARLDEAFAGKMDLELYRTLTNVSLDGYVPVLVSYREEYGGQLLPELRNIGAHVEFISRYIPVVAARIPVRGIESIGDVPYVTGLWLDGNVSLAYPRSGVQSFSDLTRAAEALPKVTLNQTTIAVGADRLWNLGYNGSGVVVAVIDTGINSTHPDFFFDDGRSKIVSNVSFVSGEDSMDYLGHGTHVAGTIAGTGRASNGTFKGVAPGALLMNVKAFSKEGVGTYENVIQALEYVIQKMPDVVSMSFSTRSPLGEDHPLSQLIAKLRRSGILGVAAAGNSGYHWSVTTPANIPGIVAVGATDAQGRRAWFSSRGPDRFSLRSLPLLSAPGVNVVAPASGSLAEEYALPENPLYMTMSGTSVATPHVSGAVALLLSAFKGMVPSSVSAALVASAQHPDEDPNNIGAGMLNVYEAYRVAFSASSHDEPAPVQALARPRASVLRERPPIATSPELLPERQRTRWEQYPGYTVLRNGKVQLIVSDNLGITWGFYGGGNNIAYSATRFGFTANGNRTYLWNDNLRVTDHFNITSDENDRLVAEGSAEEPPLLVTMRLTLLSNASYAEIEYILRSNSTLDNVTVCHFIDVDADGVSSSNEASYLFGGDALAARLYSWVGMVGEELSVAHQVGDPDTVEGQVERDSLENASRASGDVALAMKWQPKRISGLGDESKQALFLIFAEGRRSFLESVEALTGRRTRETSLEVGSPSLIVRKGMEATYNISVANLGMVPETNLTYSVEVLNIGLNESVQNLTGMLPTAAPFDSSSATFKLSFEDEGVFNVSVSVRLGGEPEAPETSWFERIRVGEPHWVNAVFPSNLTGLAGPLMVRFPGDRNYLNLTVFHDPTRGSIQAAALGLANLSVKLEQPSEPEQLGYSYVPLTVTVPQSANEGLHEGQIALTAGSGAVANVTLRIGVAEPSATVLWEDQLDLNPGWEYLQAWYVDFSRIAARQGVRLLAHSLDPALEPTRFDAIILPDPFFKFEPELMEQLTDYVKSGGSFLVFVGRRCLWVREQLSYIGLLERFGIGVVNSTYTRWSNASATLTDVPGLTNLTVVQLPSLDGRGVALNLTGVEANGTVVGLVHAVEIGLYEFARGSDSFLSAAQFEGSGGWGRVLAYASDYSFDDLWLETGFYVNWTIEAGKPQGYVIANPSPNEANSKLAAITLQTIPNKHPRFESATLAKRQITRWIEAQTIALRVADPDTPPSRLKVTCTLTQPDRLTISLEAQRYGDVWFAGFQPDAKAPTGRYEVTVLVQDTLGAASRQALSFTVVDHGPTVVALALGLMSSCFLLGFVVSTTRALKKRSVASSRGHRRGSDEAPLPTTQA